MSSRKVATAKATTKTAAKTSSGGAKPPAVATVSSPTAGTLVPMEADTTVVAHRAGSASEQANALAARIESDLMDGRLDSLDEKSLQTLMAALCKSYSRQVEAGTHFLPVAERAAVSPTEIMTTTSGLLKAGNLAVFELGMWQSWTGR